MKLIFAAGDVGGARAILPVARLAAARGHAVHGLRHGVFFREGDPGWRWADEAALMSESCDAVIYATSVADPSAFRIALAAHRRGAPVVHVLDNWASYATRLDGPEGARLVPDFYAVMDALALSEAVSEGVPEAILRVTGHPALAKLADEIRLYPSASGEAAPLLFVSEPARADSGEPGEPGYRGYDEDSVSRALVAALALRENLPPPLAIAPHPREDRSAVATRWGALAKDFARKTGHALHWHLVPPDGVRKAMHGARAVAGMSSILLYEAWLLGKPVASLQPGLRFTGLRTLAKREGVLFCTDPAALPETVGALLADERIPVGETPALLLSHTEAASRVLALVAKTTAFGPAAV